MSECWGVPVSDRYRKVGPLSVGYSAYPGNHHFGPDLRCEGQVVQLAITPTPSRAQHLEIVRAAIAARCAADPRLHFVDTAAAMVTADGQPDPQWFVGDQLHLNAAGYRLWTERVRPVVAELHANDGR